MNTSPKYGILLTAFGSTHAEGRATYARFEERVRAAYPELPVAWGFTSGFIRRRLRKQGGETLDSLGVALGRLVDDGVTHLAVQSMHVIAGSEFDQVKAQTAGCACATIGRDGFSAIALGPPLFANHPATVRAMLAMLDIAAAEGRRPDQALVLMGHGTTKHPGDLAYTAADAILRDLDPLATLATIEGYPTVDDGIRRVREAGAQSTFIMPMVAVAGNHVAVDLCGDEPESWKNVFSAAGLDPSIIPVGCGDHPAIQDIWLDHLSQALTELGHDS